jgi:hypothetical protein
MVGEIISEWWATSNRNGGRDHSGMVGDIERNQHADRESVGPLPLSGRFAFREWPAVPMMRFQKTR